MQKSVDSTVTEKVLPLSSSPIYRALNPRGIMPEVTLTPLSLRPADLNGKVVYCVSQHVGGADLFLEKVAEAFPAYAPGVKAVFRSKQAVYMSDEEDLWEEIAREADALVYGCAA